MESAAGNASGSNRQRSALGQNASIVADEALKKVEALKGQLIPKDVQVTVTRNYGETAKEKSNELLYHMLLATISVIILVALFLSLIHI